MLKMPDTKSKYFSVKYSTRIQGAHYAPSVCYPLPTGLQVVIEEMAAKGMARIYAEKVRFVTGVPYPVKKPETGALASPSAPAPEATAGGVKNPAAVPEKPGRKSGKGAFTARANREFD